MDEYDYISRKDILDIVFQYCPDDDGSCSKADVDPREMLDEIEALPAADVQPVKHGRWENEYLDEDVWWADCTNCKNDTHSRFGRVSSYAFCPNCGARMDGDSE